MFHNTDKRFPDDSPHIFDHTVSYLQNSDFDINGRITVNTGNKRVLILIQSHKCVFCHDMKKKWQRIAQEKFNVDDEIVLCTADSYENENLVRRINTFIPEFTGFPMIVAYQNGILTDIYSGDRDYDSILLFCNKKISTIM